jgi:hypothetical protein
MVQNKYQTFLDNSFLIQLLAVFYLLPILQTGVIPVHIFEVVEPDVIVLKNSILARRQ